VTLTHSKSEHNELKILLTTGLREVVTIRGPQEPPSLRYAATRLIGLAVGGGRLFAVVHEVQSNEPPKLEDAWGRGRCTLHIFAIQDGVQIGHEILSHFVQSPPAPEETLGFGVIEPIENGIHINGHVFKFD
jgi:hypothetical protein